MGKLTLEKERQIYEAYQGHLSYEKTARATGVNWKTVKRVVQSKDNKNSATNPLEQLSPEQRKTLYTELDKGFNPVDIVKKHGFPLKDVEKEYISYQRFKGGIKFRELSKRLIEYTAADKFEGLKEYNDIMEKNGFLTDDQIMDLLASADTFRLDSENKHRNEGLCLPDGWDRIVCKKCGTLILATNNSDPSGNDILHRCHKILHGNCGGSLGLL